MRFIVLPTGSAITAQPKCGYLIEDQWDDWFQYSTMYDLHITDSSSHIKYMGKVKIGQKSMGEKQRRPNLPQNFESLSNIFFSLGQDSHYYENIKNLGSTFREEIFEALNDVSYNLSLLKSANKEHVMKISLLRSVPISIVKGQFHRIALGGARLTAYNFEYTSCPAREGCDPITIRFDVDPESNPPTNIHVVIGRNGVGKTYLISNMIRSIVYLRSDLKGKTGTTRFLTGHETVTDRFSRIIFVSFSAFDELNFKTKSEKFIKIGLPSSTDGKSSIEKMTATFSTSFSNCVRGPQKRLMQKILHMLTSDPMFNESGILNFCDDNSSCDLTELASVFSRLSSGHKIILLSVTQLIEKVMEKTLVFLDEPEGHLHPPLLSAFVRALSELLTDTNGVAIIATHSPVILQEVPRSCIWKLRRTGANCHAERLQIESFGSDITTLTTEIFGLEVTNSGFHYLLQSLVNKYHDYDAVLRALKGQLGDEGRALVRTMVALDTEEIGEDDEDE